MMTKDRLNLQYFFRFFLAISFPTHFWTLLMVFRDLEFVRERTDLGGTLGYAGYSLLIALAESLILTLVVWGLSLVVGRNSNKEKIFTILVSCYYVIASASLIDMAAHVFIKARISRQYLYGLEKFPELTYSLIAVAILVGVMTCVFLIVKSPKAGRFFNEVIERLMLLSYLYLFLDAIGIIIIIWRNWF